MSTATWKMLRLRWVVSIYAHNAGVRCPKCILSQGGSVQIGVGFNIGRNIETRVSILRWFHIPVRGATIPSWTTQEGIDGTAATVAIFRPDSEAVSVTKRQFRNETRFQATLHFLRKILAAGIFSEDEYQRCFSMMIDRYNPIIGRIMS